MTNKFSGFFKPAPPVDVPPLGVGEFCHVIHGSQPILIVDVSPHAVTVGWPDGSEDVLPRSQVRRASKPTKTARGDYD